MLRRLTSDCAYAVSLQQPSELRRALLLPGAGLACRACVWYESLGRVQQRTYAAGLWQLLLTVSTVCITALACGSACTLRSSGNSLCRSALTL